MRRRWCNRDLANVRSCRAATSLKRRIARDNCFAASADVRLAFDHVRSLAYHWRTQAAVALGVMAATTVLVGALTVGDSVRGSLAHLALDRLGRIDEVLVTDHFFSRDLADRLAERLIFLPAFRSCRRSWFRAISNIRAPDRAHRASEVTIVGCSAFGSLGSGGPPDPIPPGQVVLNQPLADALAAKPGDEVLMQIGRADLIPPDSPLGRKTETTRSRRLTVVAVIPAEGLGRFGLRPSQQLPQNAFVAAETLAEMLDRSGKVNALLVAGPSRRDARRRARRRSSSMP